MKSLIQFMRRLFALMVCAAAGSAFSEFRFPMPEFSTDYEHPAVHTPLPSTGHAVWDAILFILVLSLAAFLVLKRRKRREIFALTLFCLFYFGFVRTGCVCSVGSIQNVMTCLCDPQYGLSWVVLIFFAAPLVFALLFGRVFCGSVCPLGALQELVAIRPVKVPLAVEKVLSIFPYIYVGLALLSVFEGAGFIICRYDPWVGIFRLGGSFAMLLVGGVMLLIGVFVARPYCRFLCPYSVLLKACSKLSRRHATITPAECIQCNLCVDSCPYNAILPPTADSAPEPRRKGAWRLGILIALMPVWMGIGAGAGVLLHDPLSRLDSTVRLAERVAGEELGRYEGTDIASEAFRASDQSLESLYADAVSAKARWSVGAGWLGAFIGFVIGCKLIAVSILRRRTGYEPDRGSCLSCGRCFRYCPVKGESK